MAYHVQVEANVNTDSHPNKSNRLPQSSQRSRPLAALQKLANESAAVQRVHALQDKAHAQYPVQREVEEDEEALVPQDKVAQNSAPVQRQSSAERSNGLPSDLRAGIENLSGISMDDVTVQRNSSEPAKVGAHAFAQGTNIHLGLGQDKHLPHEAWHVVQQKQGRVKPTMQMKGVSINDDVGLEREADVMGTKAVEIATRVYPISTPALQRQTSHRHYELRDMPKVTPFRNTLQASAVLSDGPVQRRVYIKNQIVSGNQVAGYQRNGTGQNVPGRARAWVEDGYKRLYDDNTEFQNHAENYPSRVGLAKKLGIWFRLHLLPGTGGGKQKFFILGENHGGYNYGDLIQETNQTGKVLGESGAVDIMAADPKTSLVETHIHGTGAHEYTMESRVAKGYYALVKAIKLQEKIVNGTLQQPAARYTLPESQWLDEMQNPQREVFHTRRVRELPYVMNQGHATYPDLGGAGVNYDPRQTVEVNVKRLVSALDKAAKQRQKQLDDAALGGEPANHEDQVRREKKRKNREKGIEFLNARVSEITTALEKKDDQEKLDLMKAQLNPIETLAQIETRKVTGNQDYLPAKPLAAANPKIATASANAFAMRNEAMFSNAVKAHQAGDYIFAGMGDNHRRDLHARFNAIGIPTISHDEFLNGGQDVDSENALEL